MKAPQKFRTKQARAAFIARRLAQLYPATPIPLAHKDAYTLLVAVVLSAQSTDAGVNKVTPRLWALGDTPGQIAQLPVEKIREIIRPVGLSPQKAKAISGLSRLLIERHGGGAPPAVRGFEGAPARGPQQAPRAGDPAFRPAPV